MSETLVRKLVDEGVDIVAANCRETTVTKKRDRSTEFPLDGSAHLRFMKRPANIEIEGQYR